MNKIQYNKNIVCLQNKKYEQVCFREAETYMVGNVKIVTGQPHAVSAHLVDQVFPDDHDLLAAVLDPDRRNIP